MLGILVYLLMCLVLLGTLAVIGYVFLVVRAMHKELLSRGIAVEVLPHKKPVRVPSNSVRKAQGFIDRLGSGG